MPVAWNRQGGHPSPGFIELRRLSRYNHLRRALMAAEPDDVLKLTNDPVARLLLSGKAETLREAEELYLDSCLPEVVRLLESGLSDEELGREPLMVMLRSHGSRGWEEAVD
jgi:hypothetical protein